MRTEFVLANLDEGSIARQPSRYLIQHAEKMPTLHHNTDFVYCHSAAVCLCPGLSFQKSKLHINCRACQVWVSVAINLAILMSSLQLLFPESRSKLAS